MTKTISSKLGILSVFLTIDGEANQYAPGAWSIFVRTRGCTVGCHWCDTKYSWQKEGAADFAPEELFEIVEHVGAGVRKVTITGGEPLEQDWWALRQFMEILFHEGYYITVETAGTQNTLHFRENLRVGTGAGVKPAASDLSFIVDYKLQSSNFKGEMNLDHFETLPEGDVVKFVIDTTEDLEEAAAMAHHLHGCSMFGAKMYFSPSHNHMEPEMLVHKMRGKNMPAIGVGLNMQMHKYIWPDDVRTEEDTGVDFTKRGLGRDQYLRHIREGTKLWPKSIDIKGV